MWPAVCFDLDDTLIDRQAALARLGGDPALAAAALAGDPAATELARQMAEAAVAMPTHTLQCLADLEPVLA